MMSELVERVLREKIASIERGEAPPVRYPPFLEVFRLAPPGEWKEALYSYWADYALAVWRSKWLTKVGREGESEEVVPDVWAGYAFGSRMHALARVLEAMTGEPLKEIREELLAVAATVWENAFAMEERKLQRELLVLCVESLRLSDEEVRSLAERPLGEALSVVLGRLAFAPGAEKEEARERVLLLKRRHEGVFAHHEAVAKVLSEAVRPVLARIDEGPMERRAGPLPSLRPSALQLGA